MAAYGSTIKLYKESRYRELTAYWGYQNEFCLLLDLTWIPTFQPGKENCGVPGKLLKISVRYSNIGLNFVAFYCELITASHCQVRQPPAVDSQSSLQSKSEERPRIPSFHVNSIVYFIKPHTLHFVISNGRKSIISTLQLSLEEFKDLHLMTQF